ncbi:MAG: NupC/NupG family nucleoside CNT transporter [Kiritimatiellae bacterium]|nr:NupC/NupG family nucleoside CNT transporter [Kiritimatiellia bacterium]
MERWVSFAGIGVWIGVAWLCSTDRRAVRWRPVVWGIGLQLVFAAAILRTGPGRAVFEWLNRAVGAVLDCQYEGARFVFNALAIPPGEPGSLGLFFAFQVLTTIVFFAALIAILYHVGVIQAVVGGFARLMVWTLRTSGAETLCAAANVFVGMTEAPLLVRPYVQTMTRSELFCVMVSGMATVAGGVLAAYVAMLRPYFPDIAGHLLAASVMSAPAALAIAKLMVPETGEPLTAGRTPPVVGEPAVNVFDAAARGALSGMQLAFNVGAVLVAFMSLLALLNLALGRIGAWVGVEGLRLERLLGWLFAVPAWLMGVPAEECVRVGWLIGEKTAVNEFVAYTSLARLLAENSAALSARSITVAAYALCGFSNFLSIGILIGGLGGMAPERRGEVAALGLRAVLAASLACFMTAGIAGLLI